MRRTTLIRVLLAQFALQCVYASAQSTDHPCPKSAGRLCNLNGYLRGLDAIAIVLGVILIVVIVGAIAYYRKAKRMKLEP